MSPIKHIFTICASAAAHLNPLSLSAAADARECSKEMLMSYFPEQYVAQTLDKFEVPQAQKSAIISELAEKDKQVISTIEERAGKMNPNPLRDPQHRQEAVKIFRDTLYELFAQVMQAHGVNDKEQIQAMLDDIQQQKAKAFAACMDQIRSTEELKEGAPAKRQNFSRQQRGPNVDHSNTELPETPSKTNYK